MAQSIRASQQASAAQATAVAPGAVGPAVAVDEPVITTAAEERVSVASQWQLMWWRFRKHRLAMVGAVTVLLFYSIVIFADFLAYADPEVSDAQRGLIAPQPINWFLDGSFYPHVYGLSGKRDPLTFKRVYAPDPENKVPVHFFARGFEYKLLGFIPTDRHLIGVGEGGKAEE